MSEPSVEFDLKNISGEVREQFDQLRRWFDYRDDRRAPSMQTFTGQLEDNEESLLYIPGVVYGYSGMGEREQSGVVAGWNPMAYNTVATPSGTIGFTPYLENPLGSFVRVYCNTTGSSLRYRVTVFYRDE